VTLDLARKFARSGHHVSVAESIPVHLCRYSKWVRHCYTVPPPNVEPEAYVSALIEIIRAEKIDLLIPTCEEVFFVSQGLERLREHCAVLVAPIEQMRRLHSKWEFIQTAQSHDLPVPETHLLTSHDDLQRFLANNERPFVLKPVFSRFATNVHVFDEVRLPCSAFAPLTISQRYPWVAQERIDGQAFCSYSIANAGKLVAHTVYAENFTAGRGACIHFAPVEQPDVDRWVERFLQCERFSGQIAFDFIVTSDGRVFPLECNPRSTSGIHLFQQDDGLPDAFLLAPDGAAASCQKVHSPKPTARTMLALAMLCYGLPSIRSWSRGKEWLDIFMHARDVILDPRDIRPFLSQLLILWYNWQGSRKFRISMLEFSTRDIEWNGL
jgi:hypothetical protein